MSQTEHKALPQQVVIAVEPIANFSAAGIKGWQWELV
jgi:hypothetical protein